jgi:hypothetical protein
MKLIESTSDLYLKRLVREINNCQYGVYLASDVAGVPHNPRLCGRAKLNKNGAVIFPTLTQTFIVPRELAPDAFMEGGTGNIICASRTA